MVKPSNITAATIIMQFCLICLAAVAARWFRHWESTQERSHEDEGPDEGYAWVLLTFLAVAMGPLLFSENFFESLRPLLPGLRITGVSWSTALLWAFVSDIAFFFVLVYLTGGSYRSPFTPVYFILPAMAFFLRQSPKRIAGYLLAIAIVFSIGLKFKKTAVSRSAPPDGPYWLVSVSCLLLSAVIGYLTRPL